MTTCKAGSPGCVIAYHRHFTANESSARWAALIANVMDSWLQKVPDDSLLADSDGGLGEEGIMRDEEGNVIRLGEGWSGGIRMMRNESCMIVRNVGGL